MARNLANTIDWMQMKKIRDEYNWTVDRNLQLLIISAAVPPPAAGHNKQNTPGKLQKIHCNQQLGRGENLAANNAPANALNLANATGQGPAAAQLPNQQTNLRNHRGPSSVSVNPRAPTPPAGRGAGNLVEDKM